MTGSERERERGGKKKFPATMQRKTCSSASAQLAKPKHFSTGIQTVKQAVFGSQLHNKLQLFWHTTTGMCSSSSSESQRSNAAFGDCTWAWCKPACPLMCYAVSCGSEMFTVNEKSLLKPVTPPCGRKRNCSLNSISSKYKKCNRTKKCLFTVFLGLKQSLAFVNKLQETLFLHTFSAV